MPDRIRHMGIVDVELKREIDKNPPPATHVARDISYVWRKGILTSMQVSVTIDDAGDGGGPERLTG